MSADQAHAAAWLELGLDHYEQWWQPFEGRFGFRADTRPTGWPAIAEPSPSVTFDLSRIDDGPRRAAAVDAINAEALLAFVWALPEVSELVVLDWQHPVHLFKPAAQALAPNPTWEIPVYPDGDYYAFCTPDFTEDTFRTPVGADAVRHGTPAHRQPGANPRDLASDRADRRPDPVNPVRPQQDGLMWPHPYRLTTRQRRKALFSPAMRGAGQDRPISCTLYPVRSWG